MHSVALQASKFTVKITDLSHFEELFTSFPQKDVQSSPIPPYQKTFINFFPQKGAICYW